MAICIIGSKVPVTIPLSFDLGEMERAKDHIPAFLPPGGEGAPGRALLELSAVHSSRHQGEVRIDTHVWNHAATLHMTQQNSVSRELVITRMQHGLFGYKGLSLRPFVRMCDLISWR